MSTRFTLRLVVLVVGAFCLAVALLDPPGSERWHLLAVLAAPAVGAALLVPVVRRWVGGRRTVAAAGLAVALCSLALGVVTTFAASSAMFVSSHDHRLFIVVLLLSCGLALLVGGQLSRSLARDLSRLGEVVDAVSAGTLSVRTGIRRRDEVGRTAAAVDDMIAALADAQAERARIAQARQLLLTGIGHDLRTPLAAVRATVESLQDRVAANPEQALAVLDRELDNVQALLDQLTDFARLESAHVRGERQPVSISEIAHEALEALTPVADRHQVRLELHADGPAVVRARELDVSRAIRNLVANAIRYTPAQCKVEVSVAAHRQDDRDGVLVRVADEGAGFPKDFRAVAFEPFTRADPARSGSGHSGLGLAITRALVDDHEGKVWLGDGPGGEVLMWIPALAGDR